MTGLPSALGPPIPVAGTPRTAEAERLQALAATGLLDGAANVVLDRLARLASRLLQVPMALVSLVETDVQYLPGLAGLDAGAAGGRCIPVSICRHVVRGGRRLVVDDALEHPLVRDDYAVRDLGIRAYAGVPLRTACGHTLGALCALDTAPQRWTSEHVETLEDLAAAAMAEIQLRRTARALHVAHADLESVFGAVGALVWTWDFATNAVRHAGTLLERLGYGPADVPDAADALAAWWIAQVHADDREAHIQRAHAMQRGLLETLDVEYRFRRADGTYATLASQFRVDADAAGRPLRAVGIDCDVSTRAEVDRRHREGEAKLRLALDAARMVAWEVRAPADHRPSARARARALELSLIGSGGTRHLSVAGGLRLLAPADRARVSEALDRALRGEGALSEEFEIACCAAAEPRWFMATGGRPQERNPDGPLAAGVLLETSERKRLEARLTDQAHRDALTGLANRLLLGQRIRAALAQAGEHRAPAVLLVDLDDFKRINDSLGHPAGDDLLRQVAERLREATRGSDTVSRLGGDEFAILLAGARDIVDATIVADRVVDALGAHFVLGGREIRIGASVGIAVAERGDDMEALLRNADLALYHAKASGRGRHVAYRPSMHQEAVQRLELEGELRQALADGGLAVHFQPVVSLATGETVGAESLVRWRHPTRGAIPPAVFIPIAESSDLIVTLGRWVLGTSCHAAARWPTAPGGAPRSVAVNVSGRQLQRPGFVQDVTEALSASGLQPDRLVLEVTESILLTNLDEMLPRLEAVRALGVRLALDDFGTGYSSLAYLQRLPVDVLKVDRSFTAEILTDARRAAVVGAVLQLARNLSLRVVAEGIEDAEQRRALTEMHCELGQGFHFSPALDEADFGLWLTREAMRDPAAPRKRAEPSSSGATGREANGRRTARDSGAVLVVEDDDGFRTVLARTLERAGYRVLAAADGADALRTLATSGAEPCMMVTDLRMPELDGSALAAALEIRYPDLPVVFVSAAAPGSIKPRLARPQTRFIPKPLDDEALLAAVRELLAPG